MTLYSQARPSDSYMIPAETPSLLRSRYGLAIETVLTRQLLEAQTSLARRESLSPGRKSINGSSGNV